MSKDILVACMGQVNAEMLELSLPSSIELVCFSTYYTTTKPRRTLKKTVNLK